MRTLLRSDVFFSSSSFLFLPYLLLLASQLISTSLGLTLSKLMDDPTSLVRAHSDWLRVGSVVPTHSRPLWFSLPGMVPLASDPTNFSSKVVPASANRYSTSQQSSSWQQLANSDQQNQKSPKSATLADVNFPRSGSNRDAPLISTKVLSKRNPATQQQHSSSSSSVGDGNHYMADRFDPFRRVDLEDFFNDSPPEAATGALPPVNSASVINTAGGRRRVISGGSSPGQDRADEPIDIDGFRDILKIDQLENMFDMDLQF